MNDMIDFWSGPVGETWVSLAPVLEVHHAPVRALLLDRIGAVSGQRALDVGAGDGALSRALSAQGARVVSADVSRPLIAHARGLAGEGIEVIEADAQRHDFGEGAFDLIVSQFGVMFFEHSLAAFANLHRACAQGGRLVFVSWGAAAGNPWFSGPSALLAQEIAPAPGDPDAPGPMRFADRGKVEGMLREAGWHDVTSEEVRLDLTPPGSLREVAGFAGRLGSIGAAARRGEIDAGQQARLGERLVEWTEGYMTPEGARIPACLNLFTARA